MPLISDLAPVVVGGVIGVLGGACAPSLSHWLEKRRSILNTRRQRLEEMILLAFKHKQWVDVLCRSAVNAEAPPTSDDSEIRMQAIAAIYFPVLKPRLAQMVDITGKIEQWALTTRYTMNGRELDEINAEYQPIYDEFARVMALLISACAQEAERLE